MPATNTPAEHALATVLRGLVAAKFAVGLEHPTLVETIAAGKRSIASYRASSWLRQRAELRAEKRERAEEERRWARLEAEED